MTEEQRVELAARIAVEAYKQIQSAMAAVNRELGYEACLGTTFPRIVLTDADALADLNGTPRPDHPNA